MNLLGINFWVGINNEIFFWQELRISELIREEFTFLAGIKDFKIKCGGNSANWGGHIKIHCMMGAGDIFPLVYKAELPSK